MNLIGLTGGIGSGKSTVAARFAHHGVEIIDTDAIARTLTAPNGAAIPALRAAFGESLISPEGGLDRASMRVLVFSNPAERARLEGILHPMIEAESLRRCAASTGTYVMADVPLLVETGRWRARCNRVCVVDCPPEMQIARATARGNHHRGEVEAILAAQVSRDIRLSAADDIIDNSGTLDSLYAQVDSLHTRYLSLG